MKRNVMFLSLLAIFSIAAFARDKKLVEVKVEILDSEGVQGNLQSGGLAGAAVGRRVVTDAWTMKAIVNGEHVMLKCYENHHACHFFGVGTFDGELKTHNKTWAYGGLEDADPDLWIHFIRPLDHVDIREHWKVSGSW